MRKTVTLPDPIEDAVREYQMIQMRVRKRDVSFTESLVSMVSLGLATFEMMANSPSDSPVAKNALLTRWVEIDHFDESRWNGLLDTSYEAAAEWIRSYFSGTSRNSSK